MSKTNSKEIIADLVNIYSGSRGKREPGSLSRRLLRWPGSREAYLAGGWYYFMRVVRYPSVISVIRYDFWFCSCSVCVAGLCLRSTPRRPRPRHRIIDDQAPWNEKKVYTCSNVEGPRLKRRTGLHESRFVRPGLSAQFIMLFFLSCQNLIVVCRGNGTPRRHPRRNEGVQARHEPQENQPRRPSSESRCRGL